MSLTSVRLGAIFLTSLRQECHVKIKAKCHNFLVKVPQMARVPQFENHCRTQRDWPIRPLLQLNKNYTKSVRFKIIQYNQLLRQLELFINYGTVSQWFSTWGTRVICDTLTQKIVTLRLYFYVTLLTNKYKENDTQTDKSYYHIHYSLHVQLRYISISR